MKLIPICTLIFLPNLVTKNTIATYHPVQEKARIFNLRFVTIGFGSNMWDMQPVFDVRGTRFVYTSEEVWISPNQKKIERDTLLTGPFRISSMDSISALIADVKDSVISRSNSHMMIGSEGDIVVFDGNRKITFELYNISDVIADKIVSILNSYIPNGYRKLFITDFESIRRRTNDIHTVP